MPITASPSRDSGSLSRCGSFRFRNTKPRPMAAPMATPAADRARNSIKNQRPKSEAAKPGLSIIDSPSITNGNARPSFSPASEVSAKRTSPSSPIPGGPTPTLDASTGSVGARIAPITTATPRDTGSSATASAATPATVRGITIRISRHVLVQPPKESFRSILRPASITAKTSTSSVRKGRYLEPSSSGGCHPFTQ
jgi:hypothetical protein